MILAASISGVTARFVFGHSHAFRAEKAAYLTPDPMNWNQYANRRDFSVNGPGSIDYIRACPNNPVWRVFGHTL